MLPSLSRIQKKKKGIFQSQANEKTDRQTDRQVVLH